MTASRNQATAQCLGALLKPAREIVRKHKGLSRDLDRLPLLTWIMFRKFLDGLEFQREDEAKLAQKRYKPAIEPPYRLPCRVPKWRFGNRDRLSGLPGARNRASRVYFKFQT